MAAKRKLTLTGRSQLIVVTALALAVAGGLYWYYATQVAPIRRATAQRLDRIVAIYDSLHLSSDYKLATSNIFGQKRVYEWDSSRSYSSSRTYVREANVDATVSELRADIEQAGFTYFEEPYPGSSFTELHFKSAKGEYIRLSVSSKPRDDAVQKAGHDEAAFNQAVALPANDGPSNVTIKVNLDDNNE